MVAATGGLPPPRQTAAAAPRTGNQKGKGRGAQQAPGPAPAAPRGWGAPGPTASGIRQLTEMGFSEAVAKKALAKCVWDVNKALDLLFACGGDLQDDEPDRGAETSARASAPGPPNKVQAEAPSLVQEHCPVQREKPQLAAKEQTSHSAEAWRPNPAPASKSAVGDCGTDASTVATVSTASSPRSAGRCDKSLLQKDRDSPHVVAETTQTPAIMPASAAASQSDCTRDSEDNRGVGRQLAPAPLGDAPLPPLPVETPEEAPPAASTEVAVEEESHIAPEVEAEAPVDDDGPPPRKTIERAETSWPGDEGAYAVEAGEFIRVWSDSKTEHGWIYAEDLTDGTKVGWLPAFQLQELPAGKRWMLCTKSCEAIHDTQLSVKEGEVLLVTIGSHTAEGWCYAEHSDKNSGAAAGGPMAGWAPIFCIEWAE